MKNKRLLKISVVIPIYNEVKILPELLKRLTESIQKTKMAFELIFIDDNSKDDTSVFFQNLSSKAVVYLKKKGKQGKAFSLIEGFEKATGDILVMIDGDLQYPPEVIPQMILSLKDADVIVANRKAYKDSKVRRLLSRSFRNVFGKGLFKLSTDIQSGLKVMRREAYEMVKFTPRSPWTFDLEFLHRARNAGYLIQNFDIEFMKRKNGNSKVTLIKTSVEIGLNAIATRFIKINPVHFPPTEKDSMIGAGIGFKGKQYVTHTTIPHEASALRTFTTFQKTVIALVLLDIILGLFIAPLFTLQVIVAILSLIYFSDVLFNLYLIIKSLTFPSEISSSDKELEAINDKDLPVYSILCPLYRESHIIPHFLEAIEKISWPKSKLDVILLLEEDDKESVEAVKKMKLPSYVRSIVVPDSMPKTKPKACNYGLGFAKGEYVVIYDAEDIPDPLQLKKAYLGFGKVDNNIICLQAKLNYYNPNQNLLTRFFTAEYSLWFDVTLTGLQSMNTTIPLGGTSNHFKTDAIRGVEGWDPFNVTEDADLGVRLFRRGFKTAIIDSVTLEEANSQWKNWLRQRSRWIKGYMQTYLVHTREGSQPFNQGVHALIFQLVVGGKIAFVLINPFLWLATISYFVLYAYVGPQIEALYPTYIFYMAIFSLVFGNFLFLYYYMIGVAKKGQWDLMKYVLLIPLYWIMISIAAFISFYQLLFKPHYWEKTLHGLHLKKKEELIVDVAVEVEREKGFAFPKKWRQKFEFALSHTHYTAIALIVSNGLASFLGFGYSAYLGRVLSFEDFALVGLINGLISLVSIIFGSLGKTMTYRTGYLMGKSGDKAAISFWAITRRKSLKLSFGLGILWIVISPFLLAYFRLNNLIPLFLFSPILLVNMAASADKGLLLSRFDFKGISIVTIVEPIIKVALAVLLVYLGLKNWAYATIPASAVVAFFVGWMLVKENKKKIENIKEATYNFPFKFLLISIISGVSAIIFLNLDVIFAKHYLTPKEAGIYTLAALIGKMIYFLGALASPFTIAFVSRNDGANIDTKKFLHLTVAGTLILSLPAFIVIALFGNSIVPILFGEKALVTLPYLTLISFGMVCFSVASVYTEYYLAKKYYSFPVVALVLGMIELGLLEVFHTGVWSFVYVMSFVWISYFVVSFALHLFSNQVKSVENNISDFLGLFTKLGSPKKDKKAGIRILIFNWRDTRHRWAGGAEVYVHELAKRLVSKGNSVTVFCGNVGRLPKNEVMDGIQIYRRGGFFMVYVWAMLYYIFRFRGNYDVIIDSENGIPFFTPLYSKEKTFLLIHHVHQEVFRKSLRWPGSWLALFLEAKLMPFVYRNTEVITVSPSSKEEIIRHKLTKKDPTIVYNGVDLKSFKPGKKSKKPMILYLGRLQYYKSLHIFIVMARRLLKNIPDAEFIIAGEGGEMGNLKKFAEKLGIAEKVKFLGKVTEAEKINLFQKAWVFVNPSLMEGWGITTIEANACGTPAVASNVPGLRDSINNPHTGFLVTYRNYDGFAKSVEKLIVDKKLWKEMSMESINWASNFSWEKSADELFKIITREEKNNIRGALSKNYGVSLSKFISLF